MIAGLRTGDLPQVQVFIQSMPVVYTGQLIMFRLEFENPVGLFQLIRQGTNKGETGGWSYWWRIL